MAGLSDLITAAAQAASAGAAAPAAAAGAAVPLIAGYFQAPDKGAPPQPGSQPAQTTAAGQNLVDYQDLAKTSPAAGANGICTVAFDPVPTGQLWLIDREVVSCTSAAATVVFVYVGSLPVRSSELRDSSSSGNLDIADNSAPLQVAGSLQLIYVWEGATPGAIATAAITYRVMS